MVFLVILGLYLWHMDYFETLKGLAVEGIKGLVPPTLCSLVVLLWPFAFKAALPLLKPHCILSDCPMFFSGVCE